MNCGPVRRRRATAIRKAPPAPIAAASVAVNMPPYRPPMTNTNSSAIAHTPRTASSRPRQDTRGARGRKRGRTTPISTIVVMYISAARMPGSRPAM